MKNRKEEKSKKEEARRKRNENSSDQQQEEETEKAKREEESDRDPLVDWNVNPSDKYVYSWGNNEKRKTMKNRICIILIRGGMNSCLIKFEDNNQK